MRGSHRTRLPGGNAVTEFRRNWAPLIIVATYCVALLVPALMPSVHAKDALPPLGMADSLRRPERRRHGHGA